MALSLVTAPMEYPVSLADAKDHMRIDLSDEDGLIEAYIAAATDYCENFAKRQFVEAEYELVADRFPFLFLIPRPPLISVESIKYLDSSGTLQTMPAADYTVDTVSSPGRIAPADGIAWPTTASELNAVRVAFTAGYGEAADVPFGIKAAVLLMTAHLHEYRELIVVGTIVADVPMSVKALLGRYRLPEVH